MSEQKIGMNLVVAGFDQNRNLIEGQTSVNTVYKLHRLMKSIFLIETDEFDKEQDFWKKGVYSIKLVVQKGENDATVNEVRDLYRSQKQSEDPQRHQYVIETSEFDESWIPDDVARENETLFTEAEVKPLREALAKYFSTK